jgi:hypothetical protein
MAEYKDIIITENFLNSNPSVYFVFGDNTIGTGYGGAAALRDHPRTYGFITKVFPDNRDSSFYTLEEYEEVFFEELQKLKKFISEHPDNKIYISQLGGGLANKYKIWDNIIKDGLEKEFSNNDNIVFLWTK